MLRIFQTQQGNISGLVARDIGTLLFAEGSCIGGDIKNIVLHLKGEADNSSITFKRVQLLGTCTASHSTHHHAGVNERTGFVLMHHFKVGQIHLLIDRCQVNCLPEHHTVNTCSTSELLEQFQANGGGGM